ncbi:class I SAM-dependent methyltransferase [Novosphingobium soli]|uniref:Class I SAM-dependent methyltransferase n=1 Tax=Novosphingobium soli TaxID=574956 RepID=A0ABV6CQY0_9SPHN
MVGCNMCGTESARPLFSAKGYDLVRCSGCDLAYVANPPDAEGLRRLYSAGETEYHAELHDPDSAASRRMAEIAARHLRFTRRFVGAGRLVDVGCSSGEFLVLAQAAGFACSGIEFSAESAQQARLRTGLEIERGTLRDTGLEAGSCDVVTLFDVIEHVPDPLGDLAAAWALLSPGGWLVLSTPNIDGLFPRASFPLAAKLGYWPHPEPPHHLFQFSQATLSAMVERAGFEVAGVHHCNIDLAYTFGTPATLARMPKRLAYAAVFAPVAKLGPLVGQGDWIYLAARKPLAS